MGFSFRSSSLFLKREKYPYVSLIIGGISKNLFLVEQLENDDYLGVESKVDWENDNFIYVKKTSIFSKDRKIQYRALYDIEDNLDKKQSEDQKIKNS